MTGLTAPNILIDDLPDAVLIDGVEYPIETDFRSCLRVVLAFEDDELTAIEKQAVLLDNLYPERPHNLKGALEQAVKFLNGGQDVRDDTGPQPRLYSFGQDAAYIFAAFRQTHGIDLEQIEYLHWWKFLALFMDLGSETTFCQLVALRKRIKSGKASKEERRMYREMKDIIDLPEPDLRTPEEKEREAVFLRMVEDGRRRKAQARAGQV